MITRRRIFLIVMTALAAAGGAGMWLAGAPSHLETPTKHSAHDSHGSGYESLGGLRLNAGEKWHLDAAARGGMEKVQALYRSHADTAGIDPASARELALGIRSAVEAMIAKCKLEPKADAALHVLLTQLLEGAEALEQGAKSDHGLSLVKQVLVAYPQYFDHPGWEA